MASTRPRDPYEVLGVARDADEKFKEAAEAYEILSDAERRATYDRYGHDGLRSGGFAPNFEGFGSISDLFDAFFGGAGSPFGFGGGGARAGGPVQGDDVGVTVEVSLAEAATGTQVELSFEAIETCERCRGNGAEPGTPIVTCDRCGGAGILQAVSRSPFGQVVRQVPCDVCGGDGRVAEQPCERCDGRGREVRRRSLRVDVPAGIADGQRIRLSGRGHAGERGGPPGDLYVLVHVAADERFLRDGDDLVTVLDVPAPQAALGARLAVPSLDGEVEVDLDAGTQPGDVVTVRGHGMPRLRRESRRGDLRVVVNVVVPKRLTKRQRRLVEELAESMTAENVRTDESLVGKLKRLIGGS